ncbi:DUF4192 domain-containing protein [Streptomyces sp. E11-3]|uniref:DUF4192 domain-containing protein n=1 Tax=Streptomyces sp. E11-3 TaxID=3110112 RepID=UPI0039810738
MTNHSEAAGRPGEQITLRGPGELADALQYLMGFHPDDSVVLVALHGERGCFGGRVRLGIPEQEQDWPSVAEQLAQCLVSGSEKRNGKPDGIAVFLCREPAEGEPARAVMERLQPLAEVLRTACGALDVPVVEALCLSDGRYWSYVCPEARCCPEDGTPMAPPGTSVMAATATYAGIQMRGRMREMEVRLAPLQGAVVVEQQRALDEASMALVPRMLDGVSRDRVEAETVAQAHRIMDRLRAAPPAGAGPRADAQDDALLTSDEAAGLIIGLQDRWTRDRVAEWMEGEEAASALRLWRALARRCVGPYGEHAAAPLTLAGWVAWSLGDEPEARIGLGMALRVDPHYTFAQLLHHACNEGLDPEALRKCLRGERAVRTGGDARGAKPRQPSLPAAAPTHPVAHRPSSCTAAGPSTARRAKERPGNRKGSPGPTGSNGNGGPHGNGDARCRNRRRTGGRGTRSGR